MMNTLDVINSSENANDNRPMSARAGEFVSGIFSHTEYTQYEAGKDIILYSGPLEICKEGVRFVGKGDVIFSFLPDYGVRFAMSKVKQIGKGDAERAVGEADLVLKRTGRILQAFVTNSSRSIDGGTSTFQLTGKANDKASFSKLRSDGKPQSAGWVTFHLLDFPEFFGSSLHEGEKHTWTGRAECAFGEWTVTLHSLPDVSKRVDYRKKTSSKVITTIGILSRCDNGFFLPEEATEVLNFLYWFFGFLSGRRCGITLVEGWQYGPSQVWSYWFTPKVGSGRGELCCLPKFYPYEILSVADALYTRWQNPDRKEALLRVIALYLESNAERSGVDLALVNVQIALELLSWVVLNEEKEWMSAGGLKGLEAEDKIRLLLNVSGISPAIPGSLSRLRQVFPGSIDGPKAITKIRNSVVHPSPTSRQELSQHGDGVLFEALQLGLWFVEAIFLRLLGYSGRVNDRLDLNGMAGHSIKLIP